MAKAADAGDAHADGAEDQGRDQQMNQRDEQVASGFICVAVAGATKPRVAPMITPSKNLNVKSGA